MILALEKETKVQKATMRVEAGAIIRECANSLQEQGWACYGLIIGLDMIRASLCRIAQRALQTGDEFLLNECYILCLLKKPEEQKDQPVV